MKRRYGLMLAACVTVLAACEQKPETALEQAKDKVGDAFDTRPHENLRDAAEDAGAAVDEAAQGVKDAAHEAAQ